MHHKKERICAIVGVGIGLVLILLGILIVVVLYPLVLENQVYKQMLLQEGTLAYDNFVSTSALCMLLLILQCTANLTKI